jgi:hypothetical protein
VAESPATTYDSLIRAVARAGSGPQLAPGQVLGDTYELIERLGGGGMGIVFRARDRLLGRDVAIKVLRAAASEHDDLRRLFEREARATAQLLHPNIVTLHHVGEHDRTPYLVLELLAGETLASRLARRGRLRLSEALTIVDAVLTAVAFAHERGALHRDLKPSNVFVTVDERVKVLDFGLALTLDTDPGPVTRAAGTPGYMSPEQRGGEAQDARTDVWSAALMLVECMLGRRPDDRDARAAIVDLDVPASLRRVLEQALDPDPARRPSTAGELRAQLTAAGGLREPAARRSRRRIAAIAVGAALVAAAVTYGVTRPRAPTEVAAAEINGRSWHVNYGEMLVHIDDDGTAYGLYDQAEGIMVGHFADGRFSGWWCQSPTRRPPDDAGRVELHFVRGDARILVEGQWTYGDGRLAHWQNNFYGVSLESAPTYTLEQRMQHHEICPH